MRLNEKLTVEHCSLYISFRVIQMINPTFLHITDKVFHYLPTLATNILKLINKLNNCFTVLHISYAIHPAIQPNNP